MSYFTQISQRSDNELTSGLIRPQETQKAALTDIHDPFQETVDVPADATENAVFVPVTRQSPATPVDEKSTASTSEEHEKPSVEPPPTVVFQSVHPVEKQQGKVELTEKIVEIQPTQEQIAKPKPQQEKVKDSTVSSENQPIEPPIEVSEKASSIRIIGPPPIEPSDFRSLEETQTDPQEAVEEQPLSKPAIAKEPQLPANKERPTAQQKALLPKRPVPPKKASKKAEPQLSIGKITVELKTPPPLTPPQKKTSRPAKRSSRTVNRQPSKLKYNSRFGLGQL